MRNNIVFQSFQNSFLIANVVFKKKNCSIVMYINLLFMKNSCSIFFQRLVSGQGFIMACFFFQLLLMMSCGNKGEYVCYNASFQEISRLAEKENKSFCIVACDSSYVSLVYDSLLRNQFEFLKEDAIFNMINKESEDWLWLRQLACTNRLPVTIVFSPQAKIKTILTGATKRCFKYINRAIHDDKASLDYIYDNPFMHINNQELISVLNEVLDCKFHLDRGENISEDVDKTLSVIQYPFNLYLKSVNEVKRGNVQLAIQTAQSLWNSYDISYFQLYENILNEARYIINPEYNVDKEPNLFIANDRIVLRDCLLGEKQRFQMELTNMGEKALVIHEIRSCCPCISLCTDFQSIIHPGETIKIECNMEAIAKGEMRKHLTIISNGVVPVENVEIIMNVK